MTISTAKIIHIIIEFSNDRSITNVNKNAQENNMKSTSSSSPKSQYLNEKSRISYDLSRHSSVPSSSRTSIQQFDFNPEMTYIYLMNADSFEGIDTSLLQEFIPFLLDKIQLFGIQKKFDEAEEAQKLLKFIKIFTPLT